MRALWPAMFTASAKGYKYQLNSALVINTLNIFECAVKCQAYNLCTAFSYSDSSHNCSRVSDSNTTMIVAAGEEAFVIVFSPYAGAN
jgi:hypothetical protein